MTSTISSAPLFIMACTIQHGPAPCQTTLNPFLFRMQSHSVTTVTTDYHSSEENYYCKKIIFDRNFITQTPVSFSSSICSKKEKIQSLKNLPFCVHIKTPHLNFFLVSVFYAGSLCEVEGINTDKVRPTHEVLPNIEFMHTRSSVT